MHKSKQLNFDGKLNGFSRLQVTHRDENEWQGDNRTSSLSQPCTLPPSKLIGRRQRRLGRGSFREGVEVQGQSVCLSELKYVLIPHTRAYYVIDGMKALFSTNFACHSGWIGKTLQSMYTSVTFIVRH